MSNSDNLSFPKNRIKVLLMENVHQSAVKTFNDAGYQNVEHLTKALPEQELNDKLKNAQLVGLRSKTQLTSEVLQHADKLHAIAAFCIGTDQIDLEYAESQGVPVFNSPTSSTRSVAELVIGSTVHLLRGTFHKAYAIEQGRWEKSSSGSHEVRGKTLGIIGYGRIGSQVSVLAEAMGMHVKFYDIEPKLAMGNAQPVDSLEELLGVADVVTLHVPRAPENRYMISETQLKQTKKGAYLINYARGEVIVGDDVARALREGHLAGAAVDVYEDEPRKKGDTFEHVLRGLPNVILTPHIGGSTEEAQENIGVDAANKLIQFMDAGVTIGSHTVPELNLPPQQDTHRLLHIHENKPGMLSKINAGFSDLGVNILSQYLKTNPNIGYVVMDIQRGQTDEALQFLKQIPGTIRVRSLY